MRDIVLIGTLILSIFTSLPSQADENDDMCNDACNGQGYVSGHYSPPNNANGEGTCAEGETVVNSICCCKIND